MTKANPANSSAIKSITEVKNKRISKLISPPFKIFKFQRKKLYGRIHYCDNENRKAYQKIGRQ